MRYNFARIGESSGAHIFNTTAGMPSGPLDFEVSRLLMILRIRFTEMKRGDNVDGVLEGNVGSGRLPSSSEEFLAHSRHRSSALSAEDTAIVSELRLNDGSDDLLLLRTLLQILQKALEPSF